MGQYNKKGKGVESSDKTSCCEKGEKIGEMGLLAGLPDLKQMGLEKSNNDSFSKSNYALHLLSHMFKGQHVVMKGLLMK